MSALFGHVKGAFTGATTDRPGLLRAAHGGMLFLDEIGELGADEQAMLLRAVEEKRFLPVGSDRDVHSDFQLVAGTNRDLTAEVAQGQFREDLLARINLWTFRLPGLSARREDIEPNLDYELEQYTARTGTKVTFNKEARRRFLDFAMSEGAAWRANFRDLNGAVTRMATLAPGNRINVDTVEEEIAASGGRLAKFVTGRKRKPVDRGPWSGANGQVGSVRPRAACRGDPSLPSVEDAFRGWPSALRRFSDTEEVAKRR